MAIVAIMPVANGPPGCENLATIFWLAILILTVACAGIPFAAERGKLRFSLRFLFIATAYLGLGCAVVLSFGSYWRSRAGGGIPPGRAALVLDWFSGLRLAMLGLVGLWPLVGLNASAGLVLHLPIALIGILGNHNG